MGLFSDLRSLAFQRRCARALERIAEALETQARYANEREERRVMKGYRPKPKPLEVGMFDQKLANRQWRQMQVASGLTTHEELNEEYGPLPE